MCLTHLIFFLLFNHNGGGGRKITSDFTLLLNYNVCNLPIIYSSHPSFGVCLLLSCDASIRLSANFSIITCFVLLRVTSVTLIFSRLANFLVTPFSQHFCYMCISISPIAQMSLKTGTHWAKIGS